MKLFKVVVFTVILLTGGWGCELDDDCGSATNSFYDVTGLSGQNMQLNDRGYRNAELLPDSAEVRFDQYAISVYPETEPISLKDTPVSGSGFAAYACSPEPPQPTELVTDIAVFSDTDFQQAESDKILAAGDTLNSLFEIYDLYSGNITGLITFLDREKEIGASADGFFLTLVSQPKEPTTHRFTVHYHLDNGEFYGVTTPPVTVNP